MKHWPGPSVCQEERGESNFLLPFSSADVIIQEIYVLPVNHLSPHSNAGKDTTSDTEAHVEKEWLLCSRHCQSSKVGKEGWP